MTLIKTFKIPNDVKSGRYIFYVRVTHEEKVASASSWFTITGKKVLFTYKIILIILSIFIILIILIIFYHIRKKLAKQKIRKRKEKENLKKIIKYVRWYAMLKQKFNRDKNRYK